MSKRTELIRTANLLDSKPKELNNISRALLLEAFKVVLDLSEAAEFDCSTSKRILDLIDKREKRDGSIQGQ